MARIWITVIFFWNILSSFSFLLFFFFSFFQKKTENEQESHCETPNKDSTNVVLAVRVEDCSICACWCLEIRMRGCGLVLQIPARHACALQPTARTGAGYLLRREPFLSLLFSCCFWGRLWLVPKQLDGAISGTISAGNFVAWRWKNCVVPLWSTSLGGLRTEEDVALLTRPCLDISQFSGNYSQRALTERAAYKQQGSATRLNGKAEPFSELASSHPQNVCWVRGSWWMLRVNPWDKCCHPDCISHSSPSSCGWKSVPDVVCSCQWCTFITVLGQMALSTRNGCGLGGRGRSMIPTSLLPLTQCPVVLHLKEKAL